MTNDELVKLLGGGLSAGALLYLLYLVGMRIVAALDRVAAKVDDLGGAVDRVEVKVNFALGIEQADEQPRGRRTPPQGVPAGAGGYGPMRPGTRGGGGGG